MDCHFQPSPTIHHSTTITATPPGASAGVGNVSYIQTKVPQTQTQYLSTFLKPDITGTLGLLNSGRVILKTDLINSQIKNTDNVSLNNIKIQSMQTVSGKPNTNSNNNNGGITNNNSSLNKSFVLSSEKENKIVGVLSQSDANNLQPHSPRSICSGDKNPIESVTISDRILCGICFGKFSKRNNFEEHHHTVHPNEIIIYTCSICRNQDKDFNNFRNHYYRHFKKGRLRCSFCSDYRFTQNVHLNDHMKIYHPKEYEGFQNSKLDGTLIEMLPDVQENVIPPAASDKPLNLFCSLCKKKFTEKTLYDDHYKNIHNFYSIFYECSCHREFKTFNNFKNHTCMPKTSHKSSLVEKQNIFSEVVLEKNHLNTELISPLNAISVQQGSSDRYYSQTQISPSITSPILSVSNENDNNGYSNAKDPTLANWIKENNEWESILNDFYYKSDKTIDENHNNNEILNKNNDFSIDIDTESCDLFEKIRCENMFPNGSFDKRNQVQLSECETSKVKHRNTCAAPHDLDGTVVIQSQVPTKKDMQEQLSFNGNNLCSSNIHSDLLTSFIPDDLFQFTENFALQDFNETINNVHSDKKCEKDLSRNEITSDSIKTTNDLNFEMKKSSNVEQTDRISQKSDTEFVSNKKFSVIIKTKEPYLMCYICKHEFNSKDKLSKHIDAHHPSWHVIYKCRFCYFDEQNFPKYDKHICNVFYTRKTGRKCGDCKKEFRSSEDLTKHIDTEHKGDKKKRWTHMGFLCKKCNKKFPKKSFYDSHYKEIHSSTIVYTCAWCQKQYVNYDSFRSHCYTHTMSGKFRCSYCGKEFSKQYKLTSHERAVHFGESCSAVSHSSPRSNTSSSPQSNMSFWMSPDYESSQTDLDIDISSVSTLEIQDGETQSRIDCSDDTFDIKNDLVASRSIDNTSISGLNVMHSDIEDSMNLILHPAETFNNSSVNSTHYATPQGDFEDDTNSQRLSDIIEIDCINSPESGIDCLNSPISDFQSTPDYNNDCQSSTQNAFYCRSPFKTRSMQQHQFQQGNIMEVLCGICWTIFLGRNILEEHFQTKHGSLIASYGCVVCKVTHRTYEALQSHWYSHKWSYQNKILDSQDLTASQNVDSSWGLDEGLYEMGELSSSGSFSSVCGYRNKDNASPINRKRKNDFCYVCGTTLDSKAVPHEQNICQHCSVIFKDQVEFLEHQKYRHTNIDNMFVSNKTMIRKMKTSGEETVTADCLKTKALSKHNVDNCIQSVINTSEDFKHSVISNEYNKGIKYNDIVSCSNDKFSKEREAEPSKHSPQNNNRQTRCSHNHNKDMSNGVDEPSRSSPPLHKSPVQQIDNNGLQSRTTNNNNKRQCCSTEQCDDFDIDKSINSLDVYEGENTGILSSFWNNSNVIETYNSTGDPIMIARNDEDLNIVVNNKKTEDIQSRDIISDQCAPQPCNTLTACHAYTGEQCADTLDNTSQTDNTSNILANHKLILISRDTMENQSHQQLSIQIPSNKSVFDNRNSGIVFTPGQQIQILNSNQCDDSTAALNAATVGQHNNNGYMLVKLTEQCSPIVLKINIIVSTSTAVCNNTNDSISDSHYCTTETIDTKQTATSLPSNNNNITSSSDHHVIPSVKYVAPNNHILSNGNNNIETNKNNLRGFRRIPKQNDLQHMDLQETNEILLDDSNHQRHC